MELRSNTKRLISTAADLRSSTADAADFLTKFLNDTDEITRSNECSVLKSSC